jgi:hypothetical protein
MTLKTIEDYEKAIAESDNRLAELEEKLNEAYAQQDAKNTERAKAFLKHLVTHKVLAYFDNHLTLTNPVNGNNVLSFTLPTNGSARMYTIEHIVRDQSFENNLKVLTTLVETIKRLHDLCQSEETLKGFHVQTTYHLISDWMTLKLERGNITLTLKIDLNTHDCQGQMAIENDLDNVPTPILSAINENIDLRIDLTDPQDSKDPGYTKTLFTKPFEVALETLESDLTAAVEHLDQY